MNKDKILDAAIKATRTRVSGYSKAKRAQLLKKAKKIIKEKPLIMDESDFLKVPIVVAVGFNVKEEQEIIINVDISREAAGQFITEALAKLSYKEAAAAVLKLKKVGPRK